MYSIVTMCLGNKYEPILPYWMRRINEKCKHFNLNVITKDTVILNEYRNLDYTKYAWWDYIRLQYI
jgi:hypothetical protein